MPKLYDISVPIHPAMPIFPGDPRVVFEPALDIACGGAANVTNIQIGSQTGTHFDTPHHILNNGVTIEQLAVERFYGPATVIQIDESVQAITPEILAQSDLTGVTRLLLKSKNSAFWQDYPNTFQENFAALTPAAAEYLVNQGIELIGIDYLSIELFENDNLGAHKALLNHNVIILEGLNLTAVPPGKYTLSAFPVLYQGLDGAPTRAVLIAA